MSARRLLRDATGLLLATALLVGALEIGLRGLWTLRNAAAPVVLLPYTAAQDWGAVPPWLDDLRILEADPALLWRGRAGVRRTYLDVYGPADREADRAALLQRFWPRVPAALRGRPTWSIALGSHGFREHEFAREKAPGVLRIACLGDSWTFGANVDQAAAYPQRLGALLRERFPQLPTEVLNLGVMGYSSRQGLELLRGVVLDLAPDVVVIGFAMNDSLVAGWRDADAVGKMAADGFAILDRLESLRLARYWVKSASYEPWTIGDYLARISRAAGSEEELWTGRQAVEFADESALERLARVPPSAYEANLREMVRLAQERGAHVVLLYNELWDSPYRGVVASVARDLGVAWVDTFALLAAETARRGDALAERLGLARAGAAASDVILRVHQGPHRVPVGLYVAGDHPALGDAIPNRVALHDDGRGGDERAGDGVWSRAVAIPPDERVFYVYTNSGRAGLWEGLDVPDLRHLAHPAPGYRPIETFGALPLQADGWHTDGDGYALLAEAIRAALPASLFP